MLRCPTYKPLLTAIILMVATTTAFADRWANIRNSCRGQTLNVSAQLMDIPWGQSWEKACAKKLGRGVGFGISRKADRCINNAGMWGEWSVANHPNCAPNYEWGEVKESCSANAVQTVSAKLFNIPHGEDWASACNAMSASGQVSAKGVSGMPDRCKVVAAGVYGEWDKQGVSSCAKSANWEPPKEAGCFGPSRQVYTSRLWDIPAGQDWVDFCRKTNGPDGRGRPARCVKDALSTGVWGQWYGAESSCSTPLEWGKFKDNGCVRDMKTPDANAGGISSEGFRSYSAVLYNAGGDWLEACRKARVSGSSHSGLVLNAPYPTACVLADADDALSWVTTAVIGAGTAFISAPTGPYAIMATGAAIGLVSKAAEAGLFEVIDANLNVWGIVWVEDSACGVVDYGDASDRSFTSSTDGSSNSLLNQRQRAQSLAACPANAKSVNGSLTCSCAAGSGEPGSIWGTNVYTADSAICKAAIHAGIVNRRGGTIRLNTEAGRPSYTGSTRNGITSASWNGWNKSFRFN